MNLMYNSQRITEESIVDEDNHVIDDIKQDEKQIENLRIIKPTETNILNQLETLSNEYYEKLVEGANVEFYCRVKKEFFCGKIFYITPTHFLDEKKTQNKLYEIIYDDNCFKTMFAKDIFYISGPCKHFVYRKKSVLDPNITNWFLTYQTIDGDIITRDLLNYKMEEYKTFLKNYFYELLKLKIGQDFEIDETIEEYINVVIYEKIFNTDFFKEITIFLYKREQLGLFNTYNKEIIRKSLVYMYKPITVNNEGIYLKKLFNDCSDKIISFCANYNNNPYDYSRQYSIYI